MVARNSKPSHHSDSSFLWNLYAATVIGGFFGVKPISFESVSSTLVGWVWTLMATSFICLVEFSESMSVQWKNALHFKSFAGRGKEGFGGPSSTLTFHSKTRGLSDHTPGAVWRGMRLVLHPVVAEAKPITRRLPQVRRMELVARSRRVQPVRNDQRYVSSLQHANLRRCLWLRVSPQGFRRLIVQRPAY